MVNSGVPANAPLDAARSEVDSFSSFSFFATPLAKYANFEKGLQDSSPRGLFSPEPTFLDKNTSPGALPDPVVCPLEPGFGPPRARRADFCVRFSLDSIVFAGWDPLGLEKNALFKNALWL